MLTRSRREHLPRASCSPTLSAGVFFQLAFHTHTHKTSWKNKQLVVKRVPCAEKKVFISLLPRRERKSYKISRVKKKIRKFIIGLFLWLATVVTFPVGWSPVSVWEERYTARRWILFYCVKSIWPAGDHHAHLETRHIIVHVPRIISRIS